MDTYTTLERIIKTLSEQGFTKLGTSSLKDVTEQLLQRPNINVGITGVNQPLAEAFAASLQPERTDLSLHTYTADHLQEGQSSFIHADAWIQVMELHRPVTKGDYELYSSLSDKLPCGAVLLVFDDTAHLDEHELTETRAYIDEKTNAFTKRPFGVIYVSLSTGDSIQAVRQGIDQAVRGTDLMWKGRMLVLKGLLEQELEALNAELIRKERFKDDAVGCRLSIVEEIRELYRFAESVLAHMQGERAQTHMEEALSQLRALLRRSPIELPVPTGILSALEGARSVEELLKVVRAWLTDEIEQRRRILVSNQGANHEEAHNEHLPAKIKIMTELLTEVVPNVE